MPSSYPFVESWSRMRDNLGGCHFASKGQHKVAGANGPGGEAPLTPPSPEGA